MFYHFREHRFIVVKGNFLFVTEQKTGKRITKKSPTLCGGFFVMAETAGLIFY